MMIDKDQLVTIPQAAKLVGIYVELFRHYIKQGYTPEMIDIAGRKYFDRRDFVDWKPAFKQKSKRKYED